MDESKLTKARDYALSAGGSGMILRHGQVVMRWGDQRARYDIKSATKSFGATMLGVAINDGKVNLETPAKHYHPSLGTPPHTNAETGWIDQITLLHLATQTAGFAKPGGYEQQLFRPGTRWLYSDGGPNWLAECLTLVYQRDLEDVMFERVFTPIGISKDDLQWRKNAYRDATINGIPRREFGAGIHANVEALSRLGFLYLREGRWRDQQIISKEYVALATRPVKSTVGLDEWEGDPHGNASDHYGLLWWNNADGALAEVPRDAFWAWGLYDSLIVVIPSLDLVVARCGERSKQWPREKGQSHYAVLEPFLNPIVTGVQSSEENNNHSVTSTTRSAPYPPSPVIKAVQWAPASTIVRQAKGSDNWPITWGDDGELYTAYGDGRGFEPFVDRKLSLGVCRISGGPKDFRGVNVRTTTGERLGQGSNGEKASGLLMVDGTIYMWVRNAGNSRLGWSSDRGRTWEWADWTFLTSFGCPTFLNFGSNYAGARDEYVYVYSHDNDSAYTPADRMVLARVPNTRIGQRDAYEFFEGLDTDHNPLWTKEIHDRGAVFVNQNNCYRSGITYNAALKRYLWCQTIPGDDTRFSGGFGIYDAPEPWGPWTTVFSTRQWDVGPGETSSIPTKWISDEGKTIHLVFSGDDAFSVRQATLRTESDFGTDLRN
ncbi:MAG: serine hydrolase [Planctomycetales bacterium]|nr:serine hydrolase [Planctomycetales bacterium]